MEASSILFYTYVLRSWFITQSLPHIVASIHPLSPTRAPQTLLRTLRVLRQAGDEVTAELGLVVMNEVAAVVMAARTLALGAGTRLIRHLWGNGLTMDMTVDLLV
jgi:hypothetical protein